MLALAKSQTTLAAADCSACPAGEFELQIDIKTDDWPKDTDWTVTDSTGSLVMAGGDYDTNFTVYSTTDCVPAGDYTFTITDSWANGMSAGGDGYFKGYVNGELEFSGGGEFGVRDFRDFTGANPCETDPPTTPADCSACPVGEFKLQIDIMTDKFPRDTSWSVAYSTGSVVMSGGDYETKFNLYSYTDCVQDGDYTFYIDDIFGDGICCNEGDGYFKGYVNGELEFSGGVFDDIFDYRYFTGEHPC